MKKTLIVMTIAMLTFVGKAYAEMSFGVSAALTKIDASGTETENGEANKGDANNLVVVPSVFVEYAFTDAVSIGLDYIPLGADVSNKTKSTSKVETSVTGTDTQTTTNRKQSAQAELNNHAVLYANVMLTDTMFVKLGAAFVELETDDSLATGSKYGNEDIFGGVIGVGAKTDNHRFELIYTDYEDVSLTSSVARTGVTAKNKIDAELDTLAFKYSYAF